MTKLLTVQLAAYCFPPNSPIFPRYTIHLTCFTMRASTLTLLSLAAVATSVHGSPIVFSDGRTYCQKFPQAALCLDGGPIPKTVSSHGGVPPPPHHVYPDSLHPGSIQARDTMDESDALSITSVFNWGIRHLPTIIHHVNQAVNGASRCVLIFPCAYSFNLTESTKR